LEKYIAFLRGINVGGKNKVSMPELKTLFEQNGFVDVMTYINSGNVIFASEKTNTEKIKKECELFIAGKFHFKIPVTIISAADLSEALDNAPSWWNTDENSKHNAIFVIPPVTVNEVFEQVGTIKPEYEKVDYYERVIFWSAPIETFSKTRWSKVVGTSIYDSITIRNANTVNKLIQLIK
jgi:uncharacterized protein (DUF1697 family)